MARSGITQTSATAGKLTTTLNGSPMQNTSGTTMTNLAYTGRIDGIQYNPRQGSECQGITNLKISYLY